MKSAALRVLVAVLLVVGCPVPASARSGPAEARQEALFAALQAQHLVDPDRQLLQMQDVCAVNVAGRAWSVVDTFEITHNAGETSPKGVSTILVLDRQLRSIRKMTRPPDARPLFCLGNTLFLNADDFDAGNGEDPGNAIAFLPDGSVHVSVHDRASLPVPVTRHRNHYRLP